MTDVDVAVVGRGMIGSAAGRHLAESGIPVALIGPPEPVDRRASAGPFSSHPDEGRVTRIAGRSDMWAEIAARSISRYDDIATRSGIDFHVPCGVVVVFPDVADWIDRGKARGSDIRLVDADWVMTNTGIRLRNGLPVAYEGPPAGRINPRRLVAAQTTLTARAGGTVIEETVTRVARSSSGFEVGGDWGQVTAAKVLLATGAFGSELLGPKLLVDRRPRTTLMAQMHDPGNIPSLLYAAPADDRVHEIYWVPPVRYPDGVVRIKIGGHMKEVVDMAPDALVDWFHGDGSDLEVEVLENNLRDLLPTVDFTDFRRAPCVITGTPSGHPYVGWVDDGIAVAIAGNGSAAKSSDELGRLASTLFSDAGWDATIDSAAFEPQFHA